MAEATVIDDKGKMASLSRNYGLDVDMADSALAASTVTSREYQKQCLHIYREFIKNMNCHLKDEKEVKEDLCRLRKEKITNMKYSLYRSSGEDVFSSAKEKRQKMMESMAIVSPLIFDDNRMNTPWGLDNIIDEDLLRPQTAPTQKVTGSQARYAPVDDTGGRPQTVSNTNYKPLDFLDDITLEMEMNQHQGGGTEAPPSFTTNHVPNISNEYEPQPLPTKTTERVRFATPSPVGDKSESKTELDEETDGIVDPKTERTRARNITINAMSFAKLSIGEILAKLKHKDGKFKIKPISMTYTPNEVDAVFIAKDPTKEKMALVRQNTNCKSSTISTDLKVNNRIAIMKSLMGIKVKKKTVSEIFDNGRDRKTRHFRIVLKNPKGRSIVPEEATPEVSKEDDENAVPIHVSITPINPKKPNLKPQNDSLANQRSTPIYSRDPHNRTGRVPTIHANNDTDGAFVRTSSFGSRRGYENARNDSRMSLTSTYSQDPLQRSINSRNQLHNSRPLQGVDGPENGTPITRSVSVMSGRESVIFQGTDADMTEMIRMLVEGEGRGGPVKQPGYNRSASRASATASVAGSHFGRRIKTPSRRMVTPTSMLSDSEMSFGGVSRPLSVNKRTTKQLVKDMIRQDKEYQENMDTMRRRMASSGRRASVAVRK
ncbi:uncharacterized protein LOC117323927 [Pecten maximus]|uniref:uncharacterized protein LOC117323927 n=1 Tax=Pecten maximus TaxID=6579 RepID=UPI0014588BE3|nr:uncharacterized protein LOC117323927 [Pecten maximus]